MKQRTLLGRPIVEVEDMSVDDIVLESLVEITPLRVRPAVAASPSDPVTFIVEVKVKPGLHTMEEMRDHEQT